MNPLEFARNKFYWLMDALKGGTVASYLKTLQRIQGGNGLPESEIQSYQEQHIRKLLEHAKTTVPLFSDQQTLDIREWPVTNKMTYRENYDRCISSNFNRDSLIEMATSGSTGTPFISYQDSTKKKHVNAETLYYNGQTGYKIGRRIIYLRSVVNEVQKSSFQQFYQNIYLLDCNDLSDEGIREKMKRIVKLSKGWGAMMMGYASTFEAFHQYFEKYGVDEVKDAKIYGIASGSEMLYDPTRESMEKAFRCRCFSRYANEENGFLGQDRDENNVFYLNRTDYYFEVLKMDQDVPADEGEVGRIVLTDLFNYAMPMIRYDTGDVGALSKRGNQMVITSFGGRRVDIVTNAKGEILSPHAITNMMWSYQGVKQYQFVQEGVGKYRIVLNLSSGTINEKLLVDDFKRFLGKESIVTIQYTDNIPVLASGKKKYIVNEMGR